MHPNSYTHRHRHNLSISVTKKSVQIKIKRSKNIFKSITNVLMIILTGLKFVDRKTLIVKQCVIIKLQKAMILSNKYEHCMLQGQNAAQVCNTAYK